MTAIFFTCGHKSEFLECICSCDESITANYPCGRCTQRVALRELLETAREAYGESKGDTGGYPEVGDSSDFREYLTDFLLDHHPLLRRGDDCETVAIAVHGFHDVPETTLDHINRILDGATTGTFELTVTKPHGSE